MMNVGYAKVDDCMRVTGFLNVFAVGDCSTMSDVKTLSKGTKILIVILLTLSTPITVTVTLTLYEFYQQI